MGPSSPGLRPGRRPVRRRVDVEDASPVTSTAFVAIITALLLAFLAWAHFTRVEEVTRGEGRVIPSSTTQIIQASEPGVVQEIAVRLGQRVSRGDVLMRLDPTATASNLGELLAQRRSLVAQIARLSAEHADGLSAVFACPPAIEAEAPELCANERRLLDIRHQNLGVRIGGLRERAEQRRGELAESRSAIDTLEEGLRLARSELDLKRPLAERNIVPRVEIIQLEREINDLEGRLTAARQAVPRIESALREAELQVSEQELLYREEALAEQNGKLAQLSVVEETILAAQDRVSRTSIRSPVEGVVNAIHVSTIGAFVQPGTQVMDIVPLGDTLLIETRVRPSDIAFLRPGQKATVKVTAYDFSVFGGLDGEVVNISADSLVDEQTREPYYVVQVATDQAYLEHAGRTHPILAGMVAQVDILTGEKSILDYLLKPINKARQEALRER